MRLLARLYWKILWNSR